MKIQICAALLTLVVTSAFAQQPASKFGFVGVVGGNYGGDTLVSGNYSNGDSYSIKAGKGLMVAGGLTYAVNPAVDVQGTIGYERDSTNATNGQIKFTRTPMEVLGFYNFNDGYFRLGMGLRHVSGAHLSSSGVAANVGSADYDASTGTVLEAQFLGKKSTGQKVRLGLYVRYVAEKFTSQSSHKTVSGNHMGLGLAAYY